MATTTGHRVVGTSLAMEFVLDVSPCAPSAARAGLRRWLEGLRWPADDAEQLVFCVSEAVTNIVQHAYRSVGPVQVAARLEMLTDPGQARRLRWICIDIHDNGRWRDPDSHRPGIGLWMLRRLLDNLVVITRGTPDYGTTVSLRSNPVEEVDRRSPAR